MFIYLHKKGQSTLEYAIIIAVIVGAFVIMQAFIKRAVEGRLKQAGDQIGDQFSIRTGSSNYVTSVNAFSTERMDASAHNTFSYQNQIRSGKENAGLYNEEW